MRVDTNLIIYSGLTLLVLFSLGLQFMPGDQNSPVDGCRVGYVYDGDTVELICPNGPLTARLVGFDTPETKDPGCPAEKTHGDKATKRLRQLLKDAEVGFDHHGHDRYGRELVRLTVGDQDVGQVLIGEGLAVAYRGGARINWCDRLSH